MSEQARPAGAALLVAEIGAPHGVRGELRLKVFTEDPLAVAEYRGLWTASGRRVEIVSARPAKTVLVVRIAGIDDRDAAEALKGERLYVDRASLPPPEDEETFYHADLIGLAAADPAGRPLGRVVAVHDFGAGDLLEIAPEGGRSGALVPFTREFVPEIDLVAGRLVIAAPDGTFPPQDR